MNRALSGLQITKGSVITVALSLVAALCVSPYSGYMPDGQITFKWIGTGIAFCATIIIEILFSCTGSSKRTEVGGDIVDIRTIAIPFLAAFLIVTIHSLLQVTGAVPVNSHNGFRVLAGFDNPAGAASAMAVSFPFVLALADRLNGRRIRYAVMCGAFCVIIMILAVARSRVGILAAGVVMVLWAIHNTGCIGDSGCGIYVFPQERLQQRQGADTGRVLGYVQGRSSVWARTAWLP